MEELPERKALVAGAATTLAITTIYLGLAGYGLGRSLRLDLWGTFYYTLTVASLGAMLVAAWRRDVRVAVAGGVLALVIDPLSPILATPPFERPVAPVVSRLLFDLLMLWVTFALAATIEYAIRHPGRAREVLTPETVRVGLVTGVIHLAVVVAVRTWLGAMVWAFPNLFAVVTVLWILLGAFLVGALVGVLLQRYRLLTPALVVVSLLAVATYRTWTYVQAHGDTHFPSWFTAYMMLWFVVTLILLCVGLIEQKSRSQIPPIPP